MRKLVVSPKHFSLNFGLFIISMISVVYVSHGQQENLYSQYIAGNLSYNPAVAGNTGILTMTAIHREQWIGFNGRPRSSMFSAHTPLRYDALGVGLTVNNHSIGPIVDTYISGDVSYSISLDRTTKFSFGLKVGMDLFSFDRGILSTSSGLPHASKHDRSTIKPNIGAGVLWQGERFLFGISTPRLLRQKYYKDIVDTENLQRHHYYITAGYLIDLSSEWQLRPSTHIKITKGSPISTDISATAIYEERVWLGAYYRLKAAIGALVQVQIVDSFRAGLAAGFATHRVNNASIEVMVCYEIDALHVSRQIRPKKF